MTPKPKSLLPSEVLQQRLAELRTSRGWTQTQLAEHMTASGLSWVRSTVAKVEAGDRQVSVDELVSLAFVLGVPPIALVTTTRRDDIRLTPTSSGSSDQVGQWMAGDLDGTMVFGVIPQAEIAERIDEIDARYRQYVEASPNYMTIAERDVPGLRYLSHLVSHLQYEVGTYQGTAKGRRSIAEVAKEVVRRAKIVADDAEALGTRRTK